MAATRSCTLPLVGLAVLLLALAAGSAKAAITPTPASLAFAGYRDGAAAIYAVNADGTGEHALTGSPDTAFEAQPAYSPSGNRIAYVCGNFELCVMNADGSGQTRLTTGHWPDMWEYVDRPSWSADGSKIAFASNADGAFHIYVINADGTGLHKLAGTGLNDDDPQWSPDGSKIAFDAYRSWSGNDSAVYVMNADGTQPHRLTRASDWAIYPAWSSDGTVIAYETYDGDNSHLYLMNADGSGQDTLTGGFCDEFDPAWSPDGPILGYESNCNGRLGINVGSLTRLVRIPVPSNGFDRYPAWRPSVAMTDMRPAATTPPSVPTADARLAAAYEIWSTQVTTIDYSLDSSSVKVERETIAHDLKAIAALNAIQPQTTKGARVKKYALSGFKLDVSSSKQYILATQARSHRNSRSAAKHEHAGDVLARKALKAFGVVDATAMLPYG